jgi:trk system potassium uptake protein TrkH
MRARLARLPILVVFTATTGLVMQLCTLHAARAGDWPTARAFFYSGVLALFLSALVALASARNSAANPLRSLFAVLALTYLLVPLVMALPVAEAVPDMRLRDAWFEMLSSFTTTGASLIPDPRLVPQTVHLWRGMAGWAGALLMLVAASALLAPAQLGGAELLAPARGPALLTARADEVAALRFYRHLNIIFPWFAGLTGLLWALLAISGQGGFSSLMLAMATLSTSGILAREGMGPVGFAAEAAIFAFLILALSRRFLPRTSDDRPLPFSQDRELRLGLAIVALVAVVVALRHLFGAYDSATGTEDLPRLWGAIWGAAFTGLSFLTTTGLVNGDWITARAWSGLTPPGLVLMGLALIGGGVATTAGGVKLLRMIAIARLSEAEMERMIFPSIVSGRTDGTSTGGLSEMRASARSAWLFMMVFAITAVTIVTVLTLLGLGFETALIFAVAGLTTTGPLATYVGDLPLMWYLLPDSALAVLGLAMVLGRLEILALLALLVAQFARD